MFPNYYKQLGLTLNATREEIKKAYRKIALEFHPDRNKSPDAHEKFIAINEAYLILYDEEARNKYDAEYRIHFNSEKIKNQSKYEYSEQKNKEWAHTGDNHFDDTDLNNWSKKAKQQGAEYARMAFDDFSKMVIGFVKETGFQLGNTVLVFFGLFLTMGGCGNLIIGLYTSGEIGDPVFGTIILPIGILLWITANKNWDKHKT